MGKYLEMTKTIESNNSSEKSEISEERQIRLAADIDSQVSDPRPDLLTDHELWTLLLRKAAAVDFNEPNGLYGTLDGFRCCGARLLRIGEIIRLDSGYPDCYWRDEKAYQEDRSRWLVPHRELLTRLLTELAVER